jgi:hypothetical protein
MTTTDDEEAAKRFGLEELYVFYLSHIAAKDNITFQEYLQRFGDYFEKHRNARAPGVG